MTYTAARALVFAWIALVYALPAVAQTAGNDGRKQAQAVRVPDGSIRVDGRLDDTAWGNVPPITDFVQR